MSLRNLRFIPSILPTIIIHGFILREDNSTTFPHIPNCRKWLSLAVPVVFFVGDESGWRIVHNSTCPEKLRGKEAITYGSLVIT
jgi:hypothetical protein